ncbi:hypothetical protein SAMN05519103_01823 [Rhizobiales bacterium GAS113]|nr:hypothetical protein SAMN05519103_01823 [Rhizobiales bacterium GAS113]
MLQTAPLTVDRLGHSEAKAAMLRTTAAMTLN